MTSRSTKLFLTISFLSYSSGAYFVFSDLFSEDIEMSSLQWFVALTAMVGLPGGIVAVLKKKASQHIPLADTDSVLDIIGLLLPVPAAAIAAGLGDPDIGLNDIWFYLIGLLLGGISLFRGMVMPNTALGRARADLMDSKEKFRKLYKSARKVKQARNALSTTQPVSSHVTQASHRLETALRELEDHLT